MKSLKYVIVFLLIIQFFLPSQLSLADVYHNRIDYERVKSNLHDLDAVMQQIQKEIKRKKLQDYIIILGDSVLFGSPGNSDQSVNVFMQEQPGAPAIFNLSMPAMQLGDYYVMMLKLKKFGISTDNLILNIRYAMFIERDPFPSPVFWLADELRGLDREAYDRVLTPLKNAGFKPPSTPFQWYKYFLHHVVLPKVGLFRYKDNIKLDYYHDYLKLTGKPIPGDALGDSRPWFEKDFADFMHDPQLLQSFSDKPFDLTENSPDIYFLNKMTAFQEGKKTLVLLTGTNHEMMKEHVNKPGYIANMQALNAYMAKQPFQYADLEGRIPDSLFTDHTHLTPEGYHRMADLIWQEWNRR
ncbi:hypothetical protein [Paenibacillus sp. HJGM_3]|uniref:hypothetical protein n=1 Tax=Paenibacillus sp. HJGM_3 TaxID=3379816 RepID=UPI00385B2B8C